MATTGDTQASFWRNDATRHQIWFCW